MPSATRPPYDPVVEDIIWRSSWHGRSGCNTQQADVIRQVAYLPTANQYDRAVPLSKHLTITHGPAGRGMSEVTMLPPSYISKKVSRPWSQDTVINQSVDVNILRLTQELRENGKSTGGTIASYQIPPKPCSTNPIWCLGSMITILAMMRVEWLFVIDQILLPTFYLSWEAHDYRRNSNFVALGSSYIIKDDADTVIRVESKINSLDKQFLGFDLLFLQVVFSKICLVSFLLDSTSYAKYRTT